MSRAAGSTRLPCRLPDDLDRRRWNRVQSSVQSLACASASGAQEWLSQAAGEGFEPSDDFRRQRFSRPHHSTALAPRRGQGIVGRGRIVHAKCMLGSALMAHVQIRNVPADTHQKLKNRAANAGMSLSEYLLAELSALAELPTPDELSERIRKAGRIRTKTSPDELIRRDRDSR
jgi:plasmid stability protein